MAPYQVRWGIMATGGIATDFVQDLLRDSALRGAGDIAHKVTAVASSTSAARAAAFIADLGLPPAPQTAAHGSYAALAADPNVDIVYLATPHSHHFRPALECLRSGKPVLCEKAFTVNAAQARLLASTAREKGVFLMEAVWTRFFPLSVRLREVIEWGEIGEVVRVVADASAGAPEAEREFDPKHRMVNLDLAGGVLLDLGIYALTWVFQTMYHTLPPALRAVSQPSSISAHMTLYPPTGADEAVVIALGFPKSAPTGALQAQGLASSNLRVCRHQEDGSRPVVVVSGTKGEIAVFGTPYRPTAFRVMLMSGGEGGSGPGSNRWVYNAEFPGDGKGLYWEADEAARCLRDGKKESEGMPLDESVLIMEVMDEVRRQGGLKYPDAIESTEA